MSAPNDGYIRYKPLTVDEMRTKYIEFGMVARRAFKVFGIDEADVSVSQDVLMDIIERVEMRKLYFAVYYNIEMGEKNEAALYCFWLVKLAPFWNRKNPRVNLNLRVAIHILLTAVTYVAGKYNRKLSLSADYLKHLVYAMTYRDLSKEAFMSIVESLLA